MPARVAWKELTPNFNYNPNILFWQSSISVGGTGTAVLRGTAVMSSIYEL